MKKKRKNKKLKSNLSALICFFVILLIWFLFPLFDGTYTDATTGSSATTETIINMLINSISGKYSFVQGYEILILFMLIIYVIIALFYLLNGLGLIFNRYSKYASYLSIFLLFIGLIAILLINRESPNYLFDISIYSPYERVLIGWGVYLITLLGIVYLIAHKKINYLLRNI